MGGIVFLLIVLGIYFISLPFQLIDPQFSNHYNKYKVLTVEVDGKTYYVAKVLVHRLFWLIPIYMYFRGMTSYPICEVRLNVKPDTTIFESEDDLIKTMEISYRRNHPYKIKVLKEKKVDARS